MSPFDPSCSPAPGAYMFEQHFLEADQVEALLAGYRAHPEAVEGQVLDPSYADERWRLVYAIDQDGVRRPLYDAIPQLAAVVARLPCKVVCLRFSSLLPGAFIHPHRDLRGTFELGRVRLHVPLTTNPEVQFLMSGQPVVMRPGELWALNTSHMHSVANKGENDRVHLLIDVVLDDSSPTCSTCHTPMV